MTRRGADGLHVAGRVSATVGQNCVVTLEPLANEVDETVDLVFVPRASAEPQALGEDDENARAARRKWNDPEPLVGGTSILARSRPSS